jgi:hypothetical protein
LTQIIYLSQGKAIVYEGDFYEAGRYLGVPPIIGGNLVLSDLKDTLLTYNFPKDIFHFPLECIQDAKYTVTPVWFPDPYRYAFKVHIEYEIVPENEKQYAICQPNVLFRPAGQGIQIDIKSATKIEV